MARASVVDTDLARDDATMSHLVAGVYADLIDAHDAPRSVFGFPRFRLYLTYARERFGAEAATLAGVPEASDADVFMLTLSARGSVSIAATQAGPTTNLTP